jgi:tight adherence protein C
MPLTTLVLIIVAALAAVVAAIAMINETARRGALSRAAGGTNEPARSVLITPTSQSPLRERLFAMFPTSDVPSETRERLIHAGYDGIGAVPFYAAIRLVVFAAFILLAVTFAPRNNFLQWFLIVVIAAILGALIPMYWLTYAVKQRQDRILRSIPDAMDLLVLCVEAGLGFDAAMLNVARDMRTVHADLSHELMLVNRRVNAGMTREEALRALYSRTGVEELRVLVQNLIQADRLGTSVAKVLRVYSDTLRRKRRQRAEKRAATAALKMTIPLAGLILPALFVVILGPAMMRIYGLFMKK